MRKHPLLALASVISLTALAVVGEGFTATPKAFSSERPATGPTGKLELVADHRDVAMSGETPKHFVVSRHGLALDVARSRKKRHHSTVRHPAGGVWAALRKCESGGNYHEDSGNGYYGAYQFAVTTWRSIGYGGMPSTAPYYVQDAAAKRLESVRGWEPWPVCSRMLNL